ncbi:uncharacterized protein LOC125423775 [Ziziphus jujuba]|uniref:Uncharacterized protein LOC125423775 n=2 Tax=Ziziphus jujuba TaxID=326968 RepID=A0ABM3IT01_ZIZJJ|nr:uncharacterized protein LOC125423775 [Ziziphus jujuba]KAH7520892.1 hypothetical protein FEM48_Zijuj08G0194000 [Ziziphus jujuba var. spinosa]
MDREQEELQSLGFFGILKETFKLVHSWRKVFSQITLALILPLSFIFLAHFQISQTIFFKILIHEDARDHTLTNTPNYEKLSDIISSEWTLFWLFKAAYFTFYLILSLLSTSAIVYTIACIYTGKQVTFKKVIKVVPKVWKRLMVTFLWSFAIVFVYNIVAIALIVLWIVFVGPVTIGIVVLVLFLILYLVGFVYIGIVWHLACVVSVLEEVYGIQALKRSKALIKGKMGIGVAFFIFIGFWYLVIKLLFEHLVVLGVVPGIAIRIGIGILCFMMLFMVILFSLVIQTVIYFVCKSYHHENIDKSSLAYHLEVNLGEYVPLREKDIQLGELHA